jgi:hypothetical protein
VEDESSLVSVERLFSDMPGEAARDVGCDHRSETKPEEGGRAISGSLSAESVRRSGRDVQTGLLSSKYEFIPLSCARTPHRDQTCLRIAGPMTMVLFSQIQLGASIGLEKNSSAPFTASM